jgi:hypothetical protein
VPFYKPTFLLYGRSGFRKTTSVYLASGPFAFWFTSERNALAPVSQPEIHQRWLNQGRSVVPDHAVLLDTNDPVKEMQQAWVKALPNVRAGKYRAVVFDTISTFAQRFMHQAHAKGIEDGYGKASAWVNERILQMIHLALAENVVVIAIAHDKDMSNIEGKFRYGGPDLAGKGGSLVAAQFDLVARVAVDATPEGMLHTGFCDESNTEWLQKDRWGGSGPAKKFLMSDLNGVITRSVERSRITL